MQGDQDHRGLPEPARRTHLEGVAYGAVGQGLVASGGQSQRDACHDRPMVPVVGPGEPRPAVWDVTSRNIYVQSQAAGERVLASVTRFLEDVLRLRVNREKSAVAFIEERKFLGHRLLGGGKLGIAPKSLERAKARIREITGRSRGIGLDRMMRELNSFLTGWVTYFRYAACKSHLTELDGWIRRKLRCVRLKQCKRSKPIVDFLTCLGVPAWTAWLTAKSGKGWWRLAGSPCATHAMSNQWFASLGLVNLVQQYVALQP